VLDIKLLRNDLDAVSANLKRRGFEFDKKHFQDIEAKRKDLQEKTQALQAKRNQSAKAIGQAKAKGENIESLLKETANLGDELKSLESDLNKVKDELDNYLLCVPNLLDDSVPDGVSEEDNVEVRKWGDIPTFDFEPLDHVALGEKNNLMDFEAAAKISGARFVVLRGQLAKLHRALAQFMLDVQTKEHGYTETYLPLLVHEKCLYGSGQLPKFGEDSFETAGDFKFRLIPTSEVPMVNLYREQIVDEKDLPIKLAAQTPCFRSEAGSYGKDTRGMIRQHQFQKVELVQLVKPEDSEKALEEITTHAEKILQLLKLPYRVVKLCAGDTGFGSRMTYDLEVWLPSQNRYREISSCSNCADFQARRMQARWKPHQGKAADLTMPLNRKFPKPELLHTLNGSGLAVGRTLIAIMENYQKPDGTFAIPDVLKSYT